MEIERKFMIDGFPDGTPIRESVMLQGYLSTSPTVRIRLTQTGAETGYVLCIKGKGGLAREEVELALTEGQFYRLRALLPMPLVRKEFKAYALPDGLTLECNLVDAGEPGSFYYAEVEFDSVEAALAFTPPAFLGRELTNQPGYSMGDYWRRKLASWPEAKQDG